MYTENQAYRARKYLYGFAGGALGLLLGGYAYANTLSGDPDTSLDGTGFKLLEYRTASKADVETRNWNNPVIAASAHADGSVLILGISDNEVMFGDESFSWTDTYTVAVIGHYDADFNLIDDGVTETRFVYSGLFTADGNRPLTLANNAGTRQVRRYNLDGTLDTGFASAGTYIDTDDILGSDFFNPSTPMIFDSAGRLLIYTADIGLARFLADGTLDTDFGTDGVAGAPNASAGADITQAEDGAYYVILGDGNIVRYTASGALDTGFGNNGLVDTGTSSQRISGIAAMPDNGVVTLVNNSQGTSPQLVHYDTDGLIVTDRGINETSSEAGAQLALARGANLTTLDDGRLLLSVSWLSSSFASRQLFGLFNSDLTPDTNFDGDNGLVVHPNAPGFSDVLPVTHRTLTLDSVGRIVLVADFGSFGNDGITDGMSTWGVVRLMGSWDGESTGGGDDDTTPDSFNFTAQSGVALSSLVTSDTATIAGIDAAADITIVNGEYSIDCGASFTDAPGSITNGQTICVRHTSAATYDIDTTTTLTVGGVSADFVSTTETDPGGGADTTPDAFSFTSQTDVALSEAVTSNHVTITGIDAPTAISVSDGSEYAKDCDAGLVAFVTGPGTVEDGDAVCVRHTSADTCLTDTTSILTIGGVQGAFTSTTIDDSVDSDGDGISDCQDDAPYDAGSASPALPGGNTLAMSTDSGDFSGIEMLDADTLTNQTGRPSGQNFPYGLASYEITGLAVGATAQVSLTYPATLPAGTRIFKYNDTDGFVEFAGAVISGNTVTLTLVDGGAGDADNTANGVIVDPVGASLPLRKKSSSSGGGGSMSFIGLILLSLVGARKRRRA